MAGLTPRQFLEEAITCLRRWEIALSGTAIPAALLGGEPPPIEISVALEDALLRQDYVRAADVLEHQLLPRLSGAAP